MRPESASGSSAVSNISDIQQFDRPTTLREALIAEIRSWNGLAAGWDGHAAASPNADSLAHAASFLCLMSDDDEIQPDVMLHASGRAGLYWRDAKFYADLEFLDGDRVAYYVERGGDKHKGVVTFDSKRLPPVLAALLAS
jgi:hypothetical protein